MCKEIFWFQNSNFNFFLFQLSEKLARIVNQKAQIEDQLNPAVMPTRGKVEHFIDGQKKKKKNKVTKLLKKIKKWAITFNIKFKII